MPRRATKAQAKAAEDDKENAVVLADVEHGGFNENEVVPKAAGKSKAPASRKATVSLADELEEMTKKMNMISLEKEKAEQLLKERDAQLEEKNAEESRLQALLEAKEQEQKKLTEKVRKLQKLKEFQPTLDLPLNASTASKDSKKNPKHVKRPQTPFLLWAKDQRVQIKKDHPEATFAEVSKILGEKWKTVPEEEKKAYVDRYDVEKKVYLKIVGQEKREVEAMKMYEEEHNKKVAVEFLEQYLRFQSEKEDGDMKKKKKEKDPRKPKQPASAFFVFSNERRPNMLAENLRIPEIGKRLGEEWRALDENSREKYEKIAAEDKARYAAELESYKLKKADELEAAEEQSKEQTLIHKAQGMQLLKQREQIDQAKKTIKEEKLKKKRMKAEAVDPNKPKKPLTSYILFVMDNRKAIQQEKPNSTFAEVTATLAVRWQELPEAEKQVWADKAAAGRESYKAAMEDYQQKLELAVI
ncbi:unnamed protein product [Calypogeia fissa]